MFGVGWKLPLVSEEYASIDSAGRLVLHEPAADNKSSLISRIEDEDLIDLATTSQKSQEGLRASPPWSLQKWLLHFQAKGTSSGEGATYVSLEKLRSRRLDDALCGDDKELSGHLDNAIHWLEQMASAATLLEDLRQDHDRILHSQVVVPIGDAATGILADWAACKAHDILAQVLPQLVDQVIAYQEHLVIRRRRSCNEEKLQVEVGQLSDELKEQKRRGTYYYKKLRELQQAQLLQNTLGVSNFNDSDDPVDDVPIYTEADLKALKNSWEAKLEALEKEYQDLLEEERKKALALEDRLRAEIEALKAQLEALRKQQKQQEAPQGREAQQEVNKGSCDVLQSTVAGSQSPHVSGATTRVPSRSSPSRSPSRGGIDVSANASSNPNLPRSSLHRSMADRSAENDQAIDEHGLTTNTLPPARKSKELRLAGEDAERLMAEELKRRVFEKVLDEERARQSLVDEEDQAVLAARLESQGFGELINLIRRVDDTVLRRDIFRLLKLYQAQHKRSSSALEIVCVYCRRKPRPDQIHTYDVPSRPGSANRTSGRTPNVAPSDSAVQSLARVSSSPSVVLGLPKGTKAFEDVPPVVGTQVRQDVRHGRPSKLVAVLPTTGLKPLKGRPRSAPAPVGLPSAHRVPSSLPPGWIGVNAAN